MEKASRELVRKWRWVLGLGVVLLGAGVIAIGAPHVASRFVVSAIGLLFFLGGVAHVGSALQMRGVRAVGPTALTGVLMAICGGLFVFQTDAGVDAITLILAIFLLVQGGLKVMGALYVRPDPTWSWLMIDGSITALLGGAVLAGWPDKSFAIIGLIVGITLLFSGVSLLSVAVYLKRLDTGN